MGCVARRACTFRSFSIGTGSRLPAARHGNGGAGQPGPYADPTPNPLVPPAVVPPQAAGPILAPPGTACEWSATLDALFLERSSGGSIPLGYTFYNTVSQLPAALPAGSLSSGDTRFPFEAGLRLEISRKFDNDVTLAASYWGLQQWSSGGAVYGDPAQETVLAFSPYLQLPTLLNGLDNSLRYTYASHVENEELNAVVRLNLSDPSWEIDWLSGVRCVNLADHFTLTGSDDLNHAGEELDYHATNNLVGMQSGLFLARGWSRFQCEAGLKFGLMANIYRQRAADTASGSPGIPAGFVPYDISHGGCGLSALFDVSLGARYRISDNFALRLGVPILRHHRAGLGSPAA